MIAYLDEFRNKELSSKIAARINVLASKIDSCQIMHVCGTHEQALARWGMRSIIPENIRLIAGPGCPVCVTPASDVDAVVDLASQGKGILTFGDMMRVPSTFSSLSKEKGKGAKVQVVYGAGDAVSIAKNDPGRDYVFFSPGFETTAPMTAFHVKDGLPENLTVYSSHRLVPPAMDVLMNAEEVNLDGFILPGHVSVILGMKPYREFVKKHPVSCVVAGFDPVDLLSGICMLIEQIVDGRSEVENAYTRVVSEEGNVKAREVMNEVFEPVDAGWRGLGVFKKSGLEVREKYSESNAKKVHEIAEVDSIDIPRGCSCHKVMLGVIYPQECPLFNKKCTLAHPVGPCMVGSEGTCAIQAKYSSE